MQQTKRCASCGYINNPEDRFCQNCGGNQFVAPMVHCAACGTLVPQDHYCAHCGADLVNPNAVVWRNCTQCGNLVHITYTNCPHCSAPNLPQVPPSVHQVPPNMHQVPPNMHQMPPNMHQVPPSVHRVPPNVSQIPPNPPKKEVMPGWRC